MSAVTTEKPCGRTRRGSPTLVARRVRFVLGMADGVVVRTVVEFFWLDVVMPFALPTRTPLGAPRLVTLAEHRTQRAIKGWLGTSLEPSPSRARQKRRCTPDRTLPPADQGRQKNSSSDTYPTRHTQRQGCRSTSSQVRARLRSVDVKGLEPHLRFCRWHLSPFPDQRKHGLTCEYVLVRVRHL
jgi:hypothetical protein